MGNFILAPHKGASKRYLAISVAVLAGTLIGCHFPGTSAETTFTPAVPVLSPTVTPAPTAAGPTPLPSPTPLLTPTPMPTPAETAPVSGPGIALQDNMGEPGEQVIITGSGFVPSEAISLHWTAPDGALTDPFETITADEEGAFTLITTVPTAWPGGEPQEGDFLQLRAVTGYYTYWANFRYVERFVPGATLVLNYTNPTYGYAVDLPNSWEWDDDDETNVTFSAPTGTSGGFIRVAAGGDAAAVAQALMPEIAPGQTVTLVQGMLGASSGVQVTTSQGQVVWFVPSGGQTVIVSFWNDAGSDYAIITTSFRFTGS